MKSATVLSFWERYHKLDREIRGRAKKAYQLWTENPFHPSLRFKCINLDENIWSVRITLGYRALGILDAFVKKPKNAIFQISGLINSIGYNAKRSKTRFFTNESFLTKIRSHGSGLGVMMSMSDFSVDE